MALNKLKQKSAVYMLIESTEFSLQIKIYFLSDN